MDFQTSGRLIGTVNGHYDSPTVVAFGGIHGNEKAGVTALEKIVNDIAVNHIKINGNFYAVRGNLNALSKNVRYLEKDLNRLWTKEIIKETLESNIDQLAIDSREQIDLLKVLKNILSKGQGPFYFLDLHTTSSPTVPFITISDSINNRTFASNFGVPTILGIEEYLEGPLLSYLNEFGHVSLGFEAGQHNDENSVIHCENFIWQALHISKCIHKVTLSRFYQPIQNHKNSILFYHIKDAYAIQKNERFKMIKGFLNFQKLTKGTPLAHSNESLITSSISGYIFMPLYQKQGGEGFFIIRKVSIFWLLASKVARKLNMHQLLRILPGIKKAEDYTLRVNPKIARFLTIHIFHLLGYRKKNKKGALLVFYKKR